MLNHMFLVFFPESLNGFAVASSAFTGAQEFSEHFFEGPRPAVQKRGGLRQGEMQSSFSHTSPHQQVAQLAVP